MLFSSILQEKIEYLEENLRKEKEGNEKNMNDYFSKLKDVEVERARQKIIIDNMQNELKETKNKNGIESKQTIVQISELQNNLNQRDRQMAEEVRIVYK